MADQITVPSFEQIETVLTKLATNYSNMAILFYDIFYNTTPMDVTFQMYDEAGELQTYTIPNIIYNHLSLNTCCLVSHSGMRFGEGIVIILFIQ